ncbi:hypothetical protein G7054_g11559 [Neopestalotiopsis clavispora]|nr:hypothetical protein G7054_g11559 [Neopestalotiopsis clavispora]
MRKLQNGSSQRPRRAAAGAQFVGLVVKTLLGAAKLFQGIKEDPKRAVELLTWIEEELNSMQRLLHPDSPVFASLTTSQYVQVAPSAINARKALEKVRTVLSPLVEDIDRLKAGENLGKKIMLLWKSLFTMKMMKNIETNLNTIRILNATLLRELQICGFETQSFLREQSAQVLSIVIEYSKRDNELLQSMKQMSTLQSKTIEETKLSTKAVLQTLDTMREAETQRFQELLNLQVTYVQTIRNMSRPEMRTAELQALSRSEYEPGPKDSQFELDSTQAIKRKPKIQSSKFLKCRLASSPSLSLARLVWPEKLFNRGELAAMDKWILATVPCPIFKLFDQFISSCSKVQLAMDHWGPGCLIQRRAGRQANVRLDWDSQKTKAGLAGIIRGIKEAVSSGIASCSDMDERGCTLLTELTLLFAYLGEENSNVENEMTQLFQIAYQSKVDPTTRFGQFRDTRSYAVLFHGAPQLTLGETIVNYASIGGGVRRFYTALISGGPLYRTLIWHRHWNMMVYHWR